MKATEFSTKNQELISFNELVLFGFKTFKFLYTKKVRILFVGIIGGILGVLIALFTPVKYSSKVTFVVEESKTMGNGLTSLAGQFGFDLGGGTGGSLFAGDNILLFLKSESLCKETLLTPYDSSSKITLADRYAEVKKFKEKWRNNKEVGEINFVKLRDGNVNRLEDSLLQIILKKNILVNDLYVTRPDKKASFIVVEVSTEDEKLSTLFSQRLVQIASNKYIESKTKLKAKNVEILQRRADSLAALLNDKSYRLAATQQGLVDFNPAMKSIPVITEISAREKTMIGTIFSEVVKNLELAKSILNQETPAIQIVDQSPYPLEKIKVSKLKSFFTLSVIFSFIYCFYLLIIRWVKSQRFSQ